MKNSLKHQCSSLENESKYNTIGGGVINNKYRSNDGKELFVTVFDDNDNTNQTYKIDSYYNWNKFKHNDRVLILSDGVWGVSMRPVK